MWNKKKNQAKKASQTRHFRVEELVSRIVPTLGVVDPLICLESDKGIVATPSSEDTASTPIDFGDASIFVETGECLPSTETQLTEGGWIDTLTLFSEGEVADWAVPKEEVTQEEWTLDKPTWGEESGPVEGIPYEFFPFIRTLSADPGNPGEEWDVASFEPFFACCGLPTVSEEAWQTGTSEFESTFELSTESEIVPTTGEWVENAEVMVAFSTEGSIGDEGSQDEVVFPKDYPAEWAYRGLSNSGEETSGEVPFEWVTMTALPEGDGEIKVEVTGEGEVPEEWLYMTALPEGDGEIKVEVTGEGEVPEEWLYMTALPEADGENKNEGEIPVEEVKEGEVPGDLISMTGFPEGQEEIPGESRDGEEGEVVITALPTGDEDPPQGEDHDGEIHHTGILDSLAIIEILKGQAQGTFVVEDSLPDAGKDYQFSGNATVAGIGSMTLEGGIRSLGLVRVGQARGMVTLSNSQGTLTLALVGPLQAGLSDLPSQLDYRVVRGSGIYQGATGFGTLDLDLTGETTWTADFHLNKLVGTGMGTWEIPPQIQMVTDVGTLYEIEGQALLSGLPSMAFTGTLNSLGFVLKGHATGEMTLTGPQGSLKLALKGPEQTGFAALPSVFEATVTEATGSFTTQIDKAKLVLRLNPDGTLVCSFEDAQQPVQPGKNSLAELGLKVDSFYRTYLNREPDAAGRAQWIKVLQSGVPAEEVARGFLLSSEYFQSHGATQESYIRSLYTELLGREATQAEVNLWKSNWGNGLGQAGVLESILDSREANERSLRNLYQSYMHRDADTMGLKNWLSQLEAGRLSLDEIAARFLSSQEYKTKTGTNLILMPANPAL